MKPKERRCLSCRKLAAKEAFWRIVRIFPSRQVQLDQGMGRSAYLCPQESCLRAARQKNRLGRALKAPVPPQIYDRLWERLAAKNCCTVAPDPVTASGRVIASTTAIALPPQNS